MLLVPVNLLVSSAYTPATYPSLKNTLSNEFTIKPLGSSLSKI